MKRRIALLLAVVLCIVLCACGENAETADPVSQAEEKTVTVHAQIPASWGNPGCWAWSMPEKKDAFTEWPGQEMTKNGEWYTAEVPTWINYIIINANAGSVQTADLPVDAGKNIWVVVEDAENVQVFHEEPKADSVDIEMPKLSADYHKNMSAVLDKEEFSTITANKAVTYWTEAGYMEEVAPYSGNYTTEYIPEELIAQTPEEAMYIVRCVYSEQYVADYELGGKAYRAVMDFEVLQRSTVKYAGYYESPKVLAEATFEGGDPPEVIHDTNDHCGDRPDEAEIKKWISQVIQTANEQREAEALTQAKNTVDAGSFSYSGLVESLTDVEIWGFTSEEAVYAADNCGADWFAEAVEDAAFYISLGTEDQETLIFLLEDAGFTHEQAVYGAENSGI